MPKILFQQKSHGPGEAFTKHDQAPCQTTLAPIYTVLENMPETTDSLGMVGFQASKARSSGGAGIRV